MIWFLGGLAVLLCLLILVRWIVSLRPPALFRTARLACGALLLALAGVLFYARRFTWGSYILASVFSMFGARTRASSDPWRRRAAPRPRSEMSREEAYEVLGLEQNASVKDIRAAHRRLIAKLHPDKGGGDYLARKINEARDTLLTE